MRVAAKVPYDQQLCFKHKQGSLSVRDETCWRVYCTELATEEKTLLALLPTRRIVPTTITRITASITAYSADVLTAIIVAQVQGKVEHQNSFYEQVLNWSGEALETIISLIR